MIATANRKVQPRYDVVLSYSPQDGGLASLLRRQLADAELGVFGLDQFRTDRRSLDLLRESLVESSAFVVLLTRNSLGSPTLAVEYGAVLLWNKPAYVVHEGVGEDEVPTWLADCEKFRLDQVPELARRIAALHRPLADEDRQVIADLYREFAIPTDQILINPPVLDEMTRRFNRSQSRNLDDRRLAQELVRMRKLGRLPKLRKA